VASASERPGETGQLVFEGATAAAVIAAHPRDEPVAPSKRTELSAPPALDELVLSLLARDPTARPQSADELRRRLRALPLEKRWDADRAHAWWNIHVPELVERATAMCGPDSHDTAPPGRERQAPRMVVRS
jgi:serine/threonine-protein kinase